MERFLSNIERDLHEERGFSTVGVALALLITLALIFSAAQVYEIESVSADIQEVADAAAIAAENVVGEYCVVATLCDAVALSLALSSLCCLGLSVAAACTPPTASLSETLLQTAQKLKRAQSSFVDKAQEALEKLKLLLPLAAAAKAASVIEANSNVRGNATYKGIAILVPWQSDPLEDHDTAKSDEAFASVEDERDDLEQRGEAAERAAHDADLYKQQAYRFDSGSESAYCMYERAKSLAHLNGGDNPFYSSAETWDFDVALKRAQAYYRARATSEHPEGNSVEERARSALRKRFYDYAKGELDKGYVNRTTESFTAYFPRLPKNTEEMKRTELYTTATYPISTDASGKLVMHAFTGCPSYAQGTPHGTGSIAQMDGNASFAVCSSCRFSPSSMGTVAAASSSIDNGFEYHYLKVAELADAYEVAHKKLAEESKTLKDRAQGLIDSIMDALDEAKGARIEIDPPGKYGAIAFVMTTDPGRSSFMTGFVNAQGSFRTRAALSGATLLSESTESGKTALNSILDGYAGPDVPGIGATRIVLDLWSRLLKGYGEGQDALSGGIEEAIDAIPLASESGLGQWAAQCFSEALETLGLQPADLSPRKAVLVNTARIARADDSAFAARLVDVKIENLGRNNMGDLFYGSLSSAEDAIVDAIDEADFTIEIARIEIVQGSLEIPITVSLPRSIKDAATASIHRTFTELEDYVADFIFDRRWR